MKLFYVTCVVIGMCSVALPAFAGSGIPVVKGYSVKIPSGAGAKASSKEVSNLYELKAAMGNFQNSSSDEPSPKVEPKFGELSKDQLKSINETIKSVRESICAAIAPAKIGLTVSIYGEEKIALGLAGTGAEVSTGANASLNIEIECPKPGG